MKSRLMIVRDQVLPGLLYILEIIMYFINIKNAQLKGTCFVPFSYIDIMCYNAE